MELVYPPSTAPLLPKPSAFMPYPTIAEGDEEMLPVVEPNGMVIGRMARSYAHGGNKLLHPVVHLHIVTRDGRLLLQKRSSSKDLLPGYWDTAVGGHVGYGEYIREALFRESGEELGLTEYNPIYLKSYVFESEVEKELVNVFACVGSFRLLPNAEEVDEVRYWNMDEITDALGKGVLTPNLEQEFNQIRSTLEALL